MITIANSSIKNVVIAACTGAVIMYGFTIFTSDKNDQSQKIRMLESKIKNLEILLEHKEDDLNNARLLALRQNGKSDLVAAHAVSEICKQVKESDDIALNEGNSFNSLANTSQTLKDLGTRSLDDPRSYAEKVNDLLTKDSSPENLAVVSKSVFDMANNRDDLPDYALQSMYASQSDPELKRVIAQVLSSRGNNILIENQIAEAQKSLTSDNPRERQNTLIHLAKIHSSSAASAIAPLLNDSNIDVKLDALLALRATGNQTHINLVEKLLNDPDPAVNSLARDVIGELRNLSDSARTLLSSADIAADLPLIEHP